MNPEKKKFAAVIAIMVEFFGAKRWSSKPQHYEWLGGC